MAQCNICGLSAGVQDIHPDCASMLRDAGMEVARARLHVDLNGKLQSSLYASTRSLTMLAGFLAPLIVIFSIAWALQIFGEKNDDLSIGLCVFGGGTIGVLISALLYKWLRMQSLLARRMAIYMDNRDF